MCPSRATVSPRGSFTLPPMVRVRPFHERVDRVNGNDWEQTETLRTLPFFSAIPASLFRLRSRKRSYRVVGGAREVVIEIWAGCKEIVSGEPSVAKKTYLIPSEA